MSNDLLPAVVSVAAVAGFFLFGWIWDGRRVRNFKPLPVERNKVQSITEYKRRRIMVKDIPVVANLRPPPNMDHRDGALL